MFNGKEHRRSISFLSAISLTAEYRYNGSGEASLGTVEGWINSSGHRKNILSPVYREGARIYLNDQNEVCITGSFPDPGRRP